MRNAHWIERLHLCDASVNVLAIGVGARRGDMRDPDRKAVVWQTWS
jgi:hypothetical protein